MAEPLVLIVEDHLPIALLLRRLAERCGARVAVAHDGRQALAMMRSERPDLVLLDLVMPVMNGNEVLLTMETDPQLRALPVVVISTADQVDEAVERRLPHLGKPFSPVEVEQLIRQYLGAVNAAEGSRDVTLSPSD